MIQIIIDKFIVSQESIFSVLELGSRSNPIMLNQSEYVIIMSTDFIFFNMQIIGKKLYVKYYEIWYNCKRTIRRKWFGIRLFYYIENIILQV